MSRYDYYPPYVSVAKRRHQAEERAKKLKKKGAHIQPIIIEGRLIANTFWGKAWCKNLELYSDYDNRLPRGRSYVRHGAVVDLQISAGEITGLVNGSSLYKVKIEIAKVVKKKWEGIVNECSGKIESLIELLQGKFSKAVMEIIADPEKGLFPHPKEIKLSCSCPDWADMCKHVAAVLYGVGARLDDKPEALFILRQADHVELIAKAGTSGLTKKSADKSDQVLTDSDLSSLFGINLEGVSKKEAVSVAVKKRKIIKNNKSASVKKASVSKVKIAKKIIKKQVK